MSNFTGSEQPTVDTFLAQFIKNRTEVSLLNMS